MFDGFKSLGITLTAGAYMLALLGELHILTI
jgi:hypothetical protein